MMATTVVVSTVQAKEESDTVVPSPDDFGIFDWIHNAPGGYVNPKQEYRYENPNDPKSRKGIFAKETIKEGEVLMSVPSYVNSPE